MMTAEELSRTLLLDLLLKPAPAPRMFHPMCRTCGWSMGGLDSWDGNRCKCGKSAIGVPMEEVMKWGEE